MKKYAAAMLIATLLAFGWAMGAAASLVNDEVVVEYIVKDNSFLTYRATVDAGMERPEVEISYFYDIYFDADRITIDFTHSNSADTTNLFSGIAISDLNDVDNPDWIILGVEVQTDWQDWSNDRLVLDEDGHFIGFDFQGLTTPEGQSLTAIFEFGPNPIPIPATMVLFVTGLIGFMAFRRLNR